MKVLIVVPVYNEENAIAEVLGSLLAIGYEVLVVDDCSTDESAKVVSQFKQVAMVQHAYNLGIGGAVQTGIKYAHKYGYDVVVQFDGDGQHLAQEIPVIIEPIEHDFADLVIGSRFVSNKSLFRSSWCRRFGIRVLSNIITFLTKTKVCDVTSGFRAYGPRTISYLAKYYPTDYPEPETIICAAKNGMRIYEVPVSMQERQGGESSITGLLSIYYMIKVSFSLFIANLRSK